MTVRCAACGSTRLLTQTRLVTNDHGHDEVVLHIPPAGSLGLVKLKSDVRGDTCIDCGHVQFHAVNRNDLLLAYNQQQRADTKFPA
jgi:hypothetical protein